MWNITDASDRKELTTQHEIRQKHLKEGTYCNSWKE
jgi:hypothetical protein